MLGVVGGGASCSAASLTSVADAGAELEKALAYIEELGPMVEFRTLTADRSSDRATEGNCRAMVVVAGGGTSEVGDGAQQRFGQDASKNSRWDLTRVTLDAWQVCSYFRDATPRTLNFHSFTTRQFRSCQNATETNDR